MTWRKVLETGWRLWLESQEGLPRSFTWPYRVSTLTGLMGPFNPWGMPHPIFMIHVLVWLVSSAMWVLPFLWKLRKADIRGRIQRERERYAKLEERDQALLEDCLHRLRKGRVSDAGYFAVQITDPTKREAAEHAIESRR